MVGAIQIDSRVFIPGLGYFTSSEPITGQADPNNTMEKSTYSYVGQNQKLTETYFALDLVQMGARVYTPTTGRFLSVDPIEGGVDNNYVYPPDPVNDFDLDGNSKFSDWLYKKGYGDAANYLYDNNKYWRFAMNHPYATGAMVGVAGGMAAITASAALGQGGLALGRGGVYVARTVSGRLYVGKATNFAVRAYQHARAGKILMSSRTLRIYISNPRLRSLTEWAIYNVLGGKRNPRLENKIKPPRW